MRRPEPGGLASGARAGDLRITVPAALAWRAMTEIVRRRHPGHHFDLLQLHPGISTAGLIRLGLQPRDGGLPLRIDFHLGGPDPGSWQTPDGIGGPLLALLGREPVAAIDAIERAAGLPPWPGHTLPPSSPGVRAMRRLTAELESRVFQPRPWRTTAAFVGWSEDLVCDWHRHFTAPVVPDACGQVRPEDRQRLSQLILLHEAPDEGCVLHQADLRGEGLVVDLGTGKTGLMTSSGFNLENDV